LTLVLLAGCSPAPAPHSGTGAEQVVQDFYEALVRQEWAQAYRLLHTDSKARCSEQQFVRLAAQYRRTLGFEPKEVHVRSCEEHGAEAVAHVVFNGSAASHQKFYKDVATLRQTGECWGILLPARFGLKR
jgi:hypothetical protein